MRPAAPEATEAFAESLSEALGETTGIFSGQGTHVVRFVVLNWSPYSAPASANTTTTTASRSSTRTHIRTLYEGESIAAAGSAGGGGTSAFDTVEGLSRYIMPSHAAGRGAGGGTSAVIATLPHDLLRFSQPPLLTSLYNVTPFTVANHNAHGPNSNSVLSVPLPDASNVSPSALQAVQSQLLRDVSTAAVASSSSSTVVVESRPSGGGDRPPQGVPPSWVELGGGVDFAAAARYIARSLGARTAEAAFGVEAAR